MINKGTAAPSHCQWAYVSLWRHRLSLYSCFCLHSLPSVQPTPKPNSLKMTTWAGGNKGSPGKADSELADYFALMSALECEVHLRRWERWRSCHPGSQTNVCLIIYEGSLLSSTVIRHLWAFFSAEVKKMVDTKERAHMSLRHRSVLFQVRFKIRGTVMERGRKEQGQENCSKAGAYWLFLGHLF